MNGKIEVIPGSQLLITGVSVEKLPFARKQPKFWGYQNALKSEEIAYIAS